MNDVIKRDLLRLIDQALFAIHNKDSDRLKELSNYVIHNASLFQDQNSINMAIIIYSLSKILFRDQQADFAITEQLKRAHTLLYDEKFDAYQGVMHDLFKEISKLDTKIGMYITEVIQQSQVKKGMKIYEHGISLGRTAEIMGINQWDLLNYVGKTTVTDKSEPESNILKRLGYARELFGLKQ
jgi:hypothetical protein